MIKIQNTFEFGREDARENWRQLGKDFTEFSRPMESRIKQNYENYKELTGNDVTYKEYKEDYISGWKAEVEYLINEQAERVFVPFKDAFTNEKIDPNLPNGPFTIDEVESLPDIERTEGLPTYAKHWGYRINGKNYKVRFESPSPDLLRETIIINGTTFTRLNRKFPPAGESGFGTWKMVD